MSGAAAPLMGFFRRQGAGSEEAEDMTQEVFLKLYQNAERYQPQERLASYCFRVARNVWIDAQRRRASRPRAVNLGGAGEGREAASMAEVIPDSAPGPGDRAERGESYQRMSAALLGLPEAQRLVFELGAVQELSYAEISSILDIPEGTVKSRMFHAVRRLRVLAAPGDGGQGAQA